jgi:hypothetical protein
MPGLDGIRSTYLTVCLAVSPRATAKPWPIVQNRQRAAVQHAQRDIGERGEVFGVQARTQHLVQDRCTLLTGERLACAPCSPGAASTVGAITRRACARRMPGSMASLKVRSDRASPARRRSRAETAARRSRCSSWPVVGLGLPPRPEPTCGPRVGPSWPSRARRRGAAWQPAMPCQTQLSHRYKKYQGYEILGEPVFIQARHCFPMLLSRLAVTVAGGIAGRDPNKVASRSAAQGR